MQPRMARQRGDPLVHLRVVLHRARPERVEAGVEIEVLLGEPVVVAHDLGLGYLRQSGRLAPDRLCGKQLLDRHLGHVQRGRDERTAARTRELVDGGRHACTPSRTAATTAANRSISCPARRSVIATTSPPSYSGY